MKTVLYILIAALSLLAPVKRLDVAKLLPVEAVAVYAQAGQTVLETDTGNIGKGSNTEQALKNLEENALGVIYLDTAHYLLVAEDAQEQAQALKTCLKRSVRVGEYAGGDVKEEAKRLDVHGDSARPSSGS